MTYEQWVWVISIALWCAVALVYPLFRQKKATSEPEVGPEWVEYLRNLSVSDLKWLLFHLEMAPPSVFESIVQTEINDRQERHNLIWTQLITKTERRIAEMESDSRPLPPPGPAAISPPAHWYGPFWTIPDGKWEYVEASTICGPTVYYRTGRRAA